MNDRTELDQRKRGLKAMPDHREKQLRAALSQHAAQLDPDAITRLRTIDYRPRLGVISRIQRSLERLAQRRQLPPR